MFVYNIIGDINLTLNNISDEKNINVLQHLQINSEMVIEVQKKVDELTRLGLPIRKVQYQPSFKKSSFKKLSLQILNFFQKT